MPARHSALAQLCDSPPHDAPRINRGRLARVSLRRQRDPSNTARLPDSGWRGWTLPTHRREFVIVTSRVFDYFDIRYGCIVAKNVDNLLMAGRCISAAHVAEASLRIQQTCMATGQAAGTAAALGLRECVTPRELDPMKVVEQLEQDRAAVTPAFDWLTDLPVASRESVRWIRRI